MMCCIIEEPMVDKTRSSSFKNTAADLKTARIDNDEGIPVKAAMGRDNRRGEAVVLMDRRQERLEATQAQLRSEPAPPTQSLAAPGAIGEHIGRELRGMYEDVVSQPVPDRFLELLNKLESGTILSKE